MLQQSPCMKMCIAQNPIFYIKKQSISKQISSHWHHTWLVIQSLVPPAFHTPSRKTANISVWSFQKTFQNIKIGSLPTSILGINPALLCHQKSWHPKYLRLCANPLYSPRNKSWLNNYQSTCYMLFLSENTQLKKKTSPLGCR